MAGNANEFSIELQRFADQEIPRKVAELQQDIVTFAFAGFVQKTRVDTGFLINSWSLNPGGSVGAAIGSVNIGGPSPGQRSLTEAEANSLRQQVEGRADSIADKIEPFTTTTINNSANYAEFREAKDGMVSTTIAEARVKFGAA